MGRDTRQVDTQGMAHKKQTKCLQNNHNAGAHHYCDGIVTAYRPFLLQRRSGRATHSFMSGMTGQDESQLANLPLGKRDEVDD